MPLTLVSARRRWAITRTKRGERQLMALAQPLSMSMTVSKKPTRAKQLGVTDDEHARLFHEQGGVCAICGNPPKKRRLHVDHDHRTGIVRGLLCFRCNRALPNYVTADWLLRAYAYVNRNGEADVPDQWASLRSVEPALPDEHGDSPGNRVTVRPHA